MGKQSDAIGKQLTALTAKAIKALVLEIDANLRRKASEGGTPVDTNHARANWMPSVGTPFDGVVTAEAAHAAAVQGILRYKLGDGDLYITNNVAYIGLLNLGHSKQAPIGFIEAAIAEAQATVQAKFGVYIEVGSSFADEAAGRAAENMAAAYSPFGGDDD